MKVYCPADLRKKWPRPLAFLWKETYPQIFRPEDLRYTLSFTRRDSMRHYHFVEWFAAVHLFNAFGVHILLRRYAKAHDYGKHAIIKKLIGHEAFEFLRHLKGASPDLFIYVPDGSRCWLAEVKGPGDKLSALQRRNHRLIEKHLHLRVDLIDVIFLGSGASPADKDSIHLG